MLVVCLIIFSPSNGEVKPIIDKAGNIVEGSIAEKLFIDVNDIALGIFLREKEFFMFENSAHSPLFGEPEKEMEILRKLLR